MFYVMSVYRKVIIDTRPHSPSPPPPATPPLKEKEEEEIYILVGYTNLPAGL